MCGFVAKTFSVFVTLDGTVYSVKGKATPGCPGHFNPYDGGSPPEGPEAEYDTVSIHPDPAIGGKALVVSDNDLPAELAGRLYDEVISILIEDPSAAFEG